MKNVILLLAIVLFLNIPNPAATIGTEVQAAVPITIFGRILTASGMPVRSTKVYIFSLTGGGGHATTSSALGWYMFQGVPSTAVYNIGIDSRRYVVLTQPIDGTHDHSFLDIIVMDRIPV